MHKLSSCNSSQDYNDQWITNNMCIRDTEHIALLFYILLLLQDLFKVANRWLFQSSRNMITYDTSCWLLQGDRPSPLQWQWHVHGWLNHKALRALKYKSQAQTPTIFPHRQSGRSSYAVSMATCIGDAVCHGQFDIRHFGHKHLTVQLFHCNSLKKEVADNSNHRCSTHEVLQRSSVSLGLAITIINNWQNCYSSDLFELSI